MLVLALDPTTRTGSCALARHGSVLREAASAPDEPPAARLAAEPQAGEGWGIVFFRDLEAEVPIGFRLRHPEVSGAIPAEPL